MIGIRSRTVGLGSFLSVVLIVASSRQVSAESCFRLADQRVEPGQKDVWVPLFVTNDVPIQGFQVAGEFDPAVLTLIDVSLRFTVFENDPPEFFQANIVDSQFELSATFEFTAPIAPSRSRLPAGKERRALHLVVEVMPGARAPSTTVIDLKDRAGAGVINLLIVEGQMAPVCLVDAVIEIVAGPQRRFLRGDTDDSGSIDVSDVAILTLAHLFLGDPRPACLDAADVFDQGKIDIASPIATLSFLFMGGPAPAPPFPSRGLDPTGDSLACE